MTEDKEQIRDVSTIGSKPVIMKLPVTSQQLAGVICKKIIEKLSVAFVKGLLQGSQANTFIQCATVCKNSGQRFAKYLDQVVQMLMSACQTHDDAELKENSLQAFEVFVSQCPQEMVALGHLELVLSLCVKLISHDPNYNDDDYGSAFVPLNEESMDTTGKDDGGLQNEAQEDDECTDDDDRSWKVRRAAAKCIEAVITSRPDCLLYVYRHVSLPLIMRFRERKENVRCDVFSFWRTLLRATRPAVISIKESQQTGLPPSPDAASAVDALQSQIPTLVKIVQKQLKEKNFRSRLVALQLLADLVQVLPGCLAPFLNTMMSGILVCLADRTSTLNVQTNTLSFIHSILMSHPIAVVQPHVEALLQALLSCADDNYKVTTEVLLALQQLIKIVRSAEPGMKEHPNAGAIANEIYPVVLRRLKATDIDQEVKETAITTMATLLTHLGSYIQSEWPNCIPIFLILLKNEITRLTAVKALNLMASSELVNLDLRYVLPEAIPVLASFLRKNQRALTLATLNLLDTLVERYGTMDATLLQNVINELSPLLIESDLRCAQQASRLTTTLAAHHTQALAHVATATLSYAQADADLEAYVVPVEERDEESSSVGHPRPDSVPASWQNEAIASCNNYMIEYKNKILQIQPEKAIISVQSENICKKYLTHTNTQPYVSPKKISKIKVLQKAPPTKDFQIKPSKLLEINFSLPISKIPIPKKKDFANFLTTMKTQYNVKIKYTEKGLNMIIFVKGPSIMNVLNVKKAILDWLK